jgi:hypothetical protein
MTHAGLEEVTPDAAAPAVPAAGVSAWIEQFIPPRLFHCAASGLPPDVAVTIAIRLDGHEIHRSAAQTVAIGATGDRVGFAANLDEDLAAAALLEPGFAAHVELGAERVALALNPILRAAIAFGQASSLAHGALQSVSPAATESLLRRLPLYASREERIRTHPLLLPHHNAALARPGPQDDASPVLLPVGLRSPDGAAMVGKDGYFYVVGGSNDIQSMFFGEMPAAQVSRVTQAWIGTLSRRQESLAALGSAYAQLVIPEKMTALPQYFPGRCNTPSRLLAELDHALAAHATLRAHHVSGLDLLAAVDPRRCYRRIDSHFSPQGAFLFARAAMQRLGHAMPFDCTFDGGREELSAGDLGPKFFGFPLLEKLAVADALPEAAAGRRVVERHVPPGGGHIGRRTVIRNDAAPIQAKLVAVGNSFMDHHAEQWSVSFWLSCCFSEYHFLFAPHLDLDYIDRVRPDAVVCQTIERYLGHVPRS